VRLEPLSIDHLAGLTAIGLDGDLWRWTLNVNQTPGEMRAYVEKALAAAEAGTEVPFATIERSSRRVIGSTRFLSIDPHHRRLEIGYTWIAPAFQRTAVNTEAKLLMLTHAFNVLGALRVEFKTDRSMRSHVPPCWASAPRRKARCATTWSPTRAGAGTRSTSA
jgi:RimJ/RimL family protein N-acetyltransferase